MKKLFVLLAVLASLAPLPAAASCHTRLTLEATPDRIEVGQSVSFKTRFVMSPDADDPCDAESFSFEVKRLGVTDPVRRRSFTRGEILIAMRDRPDHAFAWDFATTTSSEEGRNEFYVKVVAVAGAFGDVADTRSTPVAVFVTGSSREQSALEQQGVGVRQGKVALGVRIGDFVEAANLAQYVGTVINYLTRLLILIATVMVIAAGFMWLMAGGAPDKITAAKKRITNAIIGLALGLSTLLLLSLINPDLVELKELKIPQVSQQKLGCIAGSIGCVCRETVGGAPQCGAGLRCVTGRYILATDENEVLRAALAGGLAGAGLSFLGSGAVGGAQGAAAGAAGAAGKIVQVPGEGAVLEQATIRGRGLAAVRGLGSGARSGVAKAAGLGGGGLLRTLGFPITLAMSGAGAGIAAIVNMGSSQELCSDGKFGSPCGDNNDCQGGLKCNDYAKICFQPPSPPGGICNKHGDCTSGTCQEYGGTGENPKYCRGNTGFRGACSVDTECETGLVCIVPLSKIEGRCGYLKTSQEPDDDDFNGNPCVIGVTASGCRERSDYKSCMYCPATGNRVWQRLEARTEAYDRILGSCKAEESYHQDCPPSD